MELSSNRSLLWRSVSGFIAGTALALCSMMSTAIESTAENDVAPYESNHTRPIALAVSGSSVGITTDYFEQTVTDAILDSGVFDSIDSTNTANFVIPMNGAKGSFHGVGHSSDTPYLLSIRIIKVETPSFSTRMTVGMNVVWELSRTAGNARLLRENIHSSYTGGAFEGGLLGANRVRAAMEGAARENIRIGVEKLASLDLPQE